MPLKFGQSVPRLYYNLARRWWRRLAMTEWTITIEYHSHESFKHGEGETLAEARLLSPYHAGEIYLSDKISNLTEEEAEAVILHELLHTIFEGVRDLVMVLFDRRKHYDKHAALELVDRHIEQSIERLVKILMQAYRNR